MSSQPMKKFVRGGFLVPVTPSVAANLQPIQVVDSGDLRNDPSALAKFTADAEERKKKRNIRSIVRYWKRRRAVNKRAAFKPTADLILGIFTNYVKMVLLPAYDFISDTVNRSVRRFNRRGSFIGQVYVFGTEVAGSTDFHWFPFQPLLTASSFMPYVGINSKVLIDVAIPIETILLDGRLPGQKTYKGGISQFKFCGVSLRISLTEFGCRNKIRYSLEVSNTQFPEFDTSEKLVFYPYKQIRCIPIKFFTDDAAEGKGNHWDSRLNSTLFVRFVFSVKFTDVENFNSPLAVVSLHTRHRLRRGDQLLLRVDPYQINQPTKATCGTMYPVILQSSASNKRKSVHPAGPSKAVRVE